MSERRDLNRAHVEELLQAELAQRGLPERVFIDNDRGVYGASPVIAVKRGEKGYYPIWSKHKAQYLNEDGVTKQQIEAMLHGSMFGWDTPSAFPQLYEGEGL